MVSSGLRQMMKPRKADVAPLQAGYTFFFSSYRRDFHFHSKLRSKGSFKNKEANTTTMH